MPRRIRLLFIPTFPRVTFPTFLLCLLQPDSRQDVLEHVALGRQRPSFQHAGRAAGQMDDQTRRPGARSGAPGRLRPRPRARASATRRIAASLLTTTRDSRGSDMYSRCDGFGPLRRW